MPTLRYHVHKPTYMFHLRMANRISLHDLASSPHPLLMQGDSSIFNDHTVTETANVSYTVDMDGICILYYPGNT